MMMMMMMCNDLMCTYKKLTRSQLSVAHNAKVKTDMPEKNKKHLSPWSQSGGWKGRRTTEEKIYGKDEF